MVDYLNRKKKKKRKERNVAGESRDSSRMWNVPQRSRVFYPKAESWWVECGLICWRGEEAADPPHRTAQKTASSGGDGAPPGKAMLGGEICSDCFLFTVNWIWSKEDLMSCAFQGFKERTDSTELIFSEFYKAQNVITSSCPLGLWGQCCGCLGYEWSYLDKFMVGMLNCTEQTLSSLPFHHS